MTGVQTCALPILPVSQYPLFFKETDIINESVLNFLLKNSQTNWDDTVVKQICDKFLSEPAKWSINAFTSPNFYNNYVNETVFAPEIIIYDWDYNSGAGGNESEMCLLEILKTSYTMIFIFSEQDNIDEIKSVVEEDKFARFKDRLSVVNKSEKDSIESIFTQIGQKEANNFAFKYGHEVIYNSNKAVNKILSDISQLSIEEFSASIGEIEHEKYTVTNDDFIDVIIPRYRKALYSIVNTNLSITKNGDPNINEVKRVWAYRSYDETPSNKVSMGDIIKQKNSGYFLVISSDCHLNKFWQKNGGYISLIPLNKTYSAIGKKQKKLMISGGSNFTSINNSQIAMTVLPAVPVSVKRNCDFIILPKSIVSIKVDKPNEIGKKEPLTYDLFKGYSKVVSVMDPFKSPLIHFIMDNITGYGCPDFPKVLQSYLNNQFKK